MANKTTLSETSLYRLNERIEMKEAEEEIRRIEVKSGKTSWRVILQILNLSYLWFATIFVYYGLNVNAVYLDYWNKYVSFIVSKTNKFVKMTRSSFVLDRELHRTAQLLPGECFDAKPWS